MPLKDVPRYHAGGRSAFGEKLSATALLKSLIKYAVYTSLFLFASPRNFKRYRKASVEDDANKAPRGKAPRYRWNSLRSYNRPPKADGINLCSRTFGLLALVFPHSRSVIAFFASSAKHRETPLVRHRRYEVSRQSFPEALTSEAYTAVSASRSSLGNKIFYRKTANKKARSAFSGTGSFLTKQQLA